MKYRPYDASRLLQAYENVIKEKIPVKRAARLFSVPLTTLKDRVDGRIDQTISEMVVPLFVCFFVFFPKI